MPNYVSDLIEEEEKKKDKSIVARLKSRFTKDYSKELPHKDEGLEDKPWDKVKTTPNSSTSKSSENPKPYDDPINNLAIDEAEREKKKKEKIASRVGGWSRSNK